MAVCLVQCTGQLVVNSQETLAQCVRDGFIAHYFHFIRLGPNPFVWNNTNYLDTFDFFIVTN